MRPTSSPAAVLCGGIALSAALAAVLVGSLATAASAADPVASPQACVAYTYSAIRQHSVITAVPPECRGLSRAEVNRAASTAIRMTATGRSKPVRRRQAIAAARWARVMLTGAVPARGPVAAVPAGQPAGGPADRFGLGGVSELAAKLGALLAWLATAGSGGLVLVRWLLAGGSPRRRTATAAPPAVILGHVGAGMLGLVLWVVFLASGWIALAWTALAVLAPVAGLGMGVLMLGLPAPVRPAIGPRPPGGRPRIPVFAIAAHGMFAVAALLLVLMATIGAG